jgi:hypothetical protein
LFQALVTRLIDDIRHPRPAPGQNSPSGATTLADQVLAIEWLMGDHGGLQDWCDLLGLDGACLQAQLLREAGLASAAPSLGA